MLVAVEDQKRPRTNKLAYPGQSIHIGSRPVVEQEHDALGVACIELQELLLDGAALYRVDADRYRVGPARGGALVEPPENRGGAARPYCNFISKPIVEKHWQFSTGHRISPPFEKSFAS